MSMQIAIASGKGGTGKTTVSVNLYYFLNQLLNNRVQLIDCDVEEPNDILFFDQAQLQSQHTVNQLIPEIDTAKCTFCTLCAEYCAFNAISIIPKLKFAHVSHSLCHSCGACLYACKFGAVHEKPLEVGRVYNYEVSYGIGIAEGRLKVGSAMQTLMVKQVKKHQNPEAEIVLLDSPPGTSCPVVETISDAHYTILVVEPTPFGMHDFKLMVKLLSDVDVKFGVIINKAHMGNDEIYQYLRKEKIELLGEIPFMKEYARTYARGELLTSIPAEVSKEYEKIAHRIIEIRTAMA